MRTLCGTVGLAQADVPGILAAAALRRRLSPPADVQFVSGDDLGRRLVGFADEPGAPDCWVLGVTPSHSVTSLVVPALKRLAQRGKKVVWLALGEPPAFLAGDPAPAEVLSGNGHLWELALGGADGDFAGRARKVESDQATPWAQIVSAASTSWDWARLYRITYAFAAGDEPHKEDLEWANRQLELWSSAKETLRRCAVVEFSGRTIAVCADPDVAAVVRPGALRDARADVDAVMFVSSPSRLTVVAVNAPDLLFLRPLLEGSEATVGSLVSSQADIAFFPGKPPRSFADLLGQFDFNSVADAGARARIARPNAQRIDWGVHAELLSEDERSWIREATSGRA